jgi:hypothetical protein
MGQLFQKSFINGRAKLRHCDCNENKNIFSVLHQLLQRASSAALHRAGVEAAAGGVRARGHQVGPHRVLQQPGAIIALFFSPKIGQKSTKIGQKSPKIGQKSPKIGQKTAENINRQKIMMTTLIPGHLRTDRPASSRHHGAHGRGLLERRQHHRPGILFRHWQSPA